MEVLELSVEQEDGIKFDNHGRILYNPEFHTNHGEPFTRSDLEYMCKYIEHDGRRAIAFALGRTESVIASRINLLKKRGEYRYYKNLNENWGVFANERSSS